MPIQAKAYNPDACVNTVMPWYFSPVMDLQSDIGLFISRASTLMLILFISGCGSEDPKHPATTEAAPPQFVGSATCGGCHEQQHVDWLTSHHYLAMLPATEESVIGGFDGVRFEYSETGYEFFVENGQFFVRADNSDGELQDFEISHTFGVEPLQQYLVTLPDGRLQALSVAWDSRPASEGGQRWFHLYPDEVITHKDELHWTGRNQNWNYMCADCHSTDLRKNYSQADDTFATTWAEINVGCEACHGPGSAHIEAAQNGSDDLSTLTESLKSQQTQVDACARCHSRRGILKEGFEPGTDFLDHYRLALLDEGLYHADGQILDEVYVVGSFLQSKMYQRGVRCTDCHDPHSAELRTPGNNTCARCHQVAPPNEFSTLQSVAYDTEDHHFHQPGTPGAQCVDCHMVSRDYMVVDPRRDHSFRIPRPDLTQSLGTPNACNDCHTDKSAEWAESEIRKRYPGLPADHYGETLAAGRARAPDAENALVSLAMDPSATAIVRATAFSLLGDYSAALIQEAVAAGLQDAEPLVRFGAIRGIRNLAPEQRWELANRALDDPILVNRLEAAVTLAPMLSVGLRQADSMRLHAAIDEYITAQTLNSDRPDALSNLGGVYAAIGDTENAEASYRQALELAPDWVPALVNLADVYRTRGLNHDAGELLEKARAVAPDNGDVRYAYGLSLVRAGLSMDAVDELRQATELRPDVALYAYTYGVALNSIGQSSDAIAALEAAADRFPDDTDVRFALAAIERDLGNVSKALEHARILLELRPLDANAQALIRELELTYAD